MPLPRLHDLRLDRVCTILQESGSTRVVDLGCGSGKLLARLHPLTQFQSIVGLDVSDRSLQNARLRLKVAHADPRLRLLQGSLLFSDPRLKGVQAAALVEVIEHLNPARLKACERNVFGFLQPEMVVLTTPNSDYNVLFPSLSAGLFRHKDHRFEWSRQQFAEWCRRICLIYGYQVTIEGIGCQSEQHGSPSQLGIFRRRSESLAAQAFQHFPAV